MSTKTRYTPITPADLHESDSVVWVEACMRIWDAWRGRLPCELVKERERNKSWQAIIASKTNARSHLF